MRSLTRQLSTILTLGMLLSGQGFSSEKKGNHYPAVIDLTIFEHPLCLLPSQSATLREKADYIKEEQNEISRKSADFSKNRELESSGKLKGSAKDLVAKYFKKRKLNWVQEEFGYFLFTLFGEARNLDKENIEMVARVINNRKGNNGKYKKTVTELAQFTSWYYKNRFDNAAMLCPDKKSAKNWNKIYKVAVEQFQSKDDFLNSKHYFAPFNMLPKNKIPTWSRGKHVVGFGGHVFLVSQEFKEKNRDLDVVYIPGNAKKMSVSHGKIKLYN